MRFAAMSFIAAVFLLFTLHSLAQNLEICWAATARRSRADSDLFSGVKPARQASCQRRHRILSMEPR